MKASVTVSCVACDQQLLVKASVTVIWHSVAVEEDR